MNTFDLVNDTPVTTIPNNGVLTFYDPALGGWDTITFSSLHTQIGTGNLSGSGNPATAVDPTTLGGTTVVIDPGDALQTDSSAISTITPTAGSGTTGNFTQATGGNQPVYRTGAGAANLNGHGGIQFNGVNSLACASGGTSFTGDFYCAMVVRVDTAIGAGLGVNLWDFGTAATGQKRTFGINGIGSNKYTWGYNTQANVNTIQTTTPTPTQGTAFVVELVQRSNGAVTCLVNGAPVIGQCVTNVTAFASNVITLGSTGFGLNATLFYWALRAGVPSADKRAGVRQFLLSRFGLTALNDTPMGSFSASAAVTEDDALSHVSGLACVANPVVIGNYTQLKTGSTTVTPGLTPAALSVHGQIAAQAGVAEHWLTNNYGLNNTLRLCNLDSSGYSVMACNRHTGEEMSAFGFGITAPWGDGGDGETFIEASNGHTTANYGGFRLLQTRLGVATSLRMRLLPSGVFEFYDQTAGASPGAVIFSIHPNGAIIPPNRSSDPSSPAKGWFYFNSSTNKLKVYNGTTWETVTSS